jgi:uncharacterized membrane protein YjjB (DUF3815 family)
MSRPVVLFLLAAFAVMMPRDAASQQRATPNAVVSRSSDAIDDTTRAAVLAARDAI